MTALHRAQNTNTPYSQQRVKESPAVGGAPSDVKRGRADLHSQTPVYNGNDPTLFLFNFFSFSSLIHLYIYLILLFFFFFFFTTLLFFTSYSFSILSFCLYIYIFIFLSPSVFLPVFLSIIFPTSFLFLKENNEKIALHFFSTV